MENKLGDFDVVVIGAGHAGIEAAVAAAKLGCHTGLFTLTLDGVGNLPCNPSIGGTAKGHLVREIDAMGGVMGLAADATFLQSRMLNRSKGPAVHSLRVQTDRRRYHDYMKKLLENTENLELKQAEITSLYFEDNKIQGVFTKLHAFYSCRAVVICTGTYLGGKIFVGDASYASGPDGHHAATELTQSLVDAGIALRRFKTGTPARVNRRSIDFSDLPVQEGDEEIVPFSFLTPCEGLKNKVVCHVVYTNLDTHKIIKDNLHRSPLYGGMIEGVGPRYCPSIEDKVVRFADKERHQAFIEPCGEDTDEMYLQGLSSSLPEEVQNALYHTIQGLEHVEIMRPAYAIEYDCVDPLQLAATLEFKEHPGLFGAGQFNGTSGYEEAAAQGLLAGINAARRVQGKEGIILPRSGSYMGTLMDDLVTKGVSDPYRMMTSRSEYRLFLRQDNADERLTPTGREAGLVSDERWEAYLHSQEVKKQERKRLEKTNLKPSQLKDLLESKETGVPDASVSAATLLKRPQISYQDVAQLIGINPEMTPLLAQSIETEIKYEGYLVRQQRQIREVRRAEKMKIPADFDYAPLKNLRLEAREKLAKVRPENVGQAARIPGVSPSDISMLAIELAAHRGEKHD